VYVAPAIGFGISTTSTLSTLFFELLVAGLEGLSGSNFQG